MKIIPVIDVLNGIAVHGIKGERKRYQPLKSILCSSSEPVELASVFESLGFNALYLADLDAILGKSANFNIYNQIIAKTSLDLMVDAGVSDIATAEEVLEAGVSKIVIGTETLDRLDFVSHAVNTFDNDRIVISIDQKGGKILSLSDSIISMDVLSITKKLVDLGVNQIILLDLDRVGTEYGANQELLRNILDVIKVDLLVGGGITSLQELKELKTLGIYGALVATVLHKGKLTIDELKSAGFL
jgi:phosphoribosylformimino-5-aminoimidazole carboxamide ribotide isomerase